MRGCELRKHIKQINLPALAAADGAHTVGRTTDLIAFFTLLEMELTISNSQDAAECSALQACNRFVGLDNRARMPAKTFLTSVD